MSLEPAGTEYHGGAGVTSLGDALALLDPSTISTLVNMYIDYIHDKPHSLFHVPTLRSDVASRTIDSALLCTILALSARFSPDLDVRDVGGRLAMYAGTLLKQNLESMTVARIQAWILLGNFAGSKADGSSEEALYFGIATRCAQVMNLSSQNANDSAVLRETKSRIWWTLYMIDRWSSAGLGIPRQMGERQKSQQLPLDEWAFHRLSVEDSQWPTPLPQLGLWAYMITLAELFGSIHDINRLLATYIVDPAEAQESVAKLSLDLDDWQQHLPESLKLSRSTLEQHEQRGLGRTFVALHLGYYHYQTLLFFQFLDQSAAQLPNSAEYARRCYESAATFSDLLRTSYDLENCEAMYVIVGHMAVVSSSVLIHILLFGEDDELSTARRRLESNFEILLKLKDWWPSVEIVTARLFLFQSMCICSAGNPFKFDRWMVKFLLEYAITLDDKTEMERLYDTSPENADSPEAPDHRRLSHRDRSTQTALSMLKR